MANAYKTVSVLFVVTCLAILVLANMLMISGLTNYTSRNEGFLNYMMTNAGKGSESKENFENYQLSGAATGSEYQPIGQYDNVRKVPANGVSAWRDTAPNEPLAGPEFTGPGPDKLFMFANNQAKPECCGSSFSCSGGCVCTTPAQRQMIAARGGNRTAPEDGI